MALPNLTATIGSGQFQSGIVTMQGKLSGISVPTGWNGSAPGSYAPLSFTVSPDGGQTWFEFCQQGNNLVIPFNSDDAFAGVDWRFWGGVTAIIVRSGVVGSTINQTASRTLILTQQA